MITIYDNNSDTINENQHNTNLNRLRVHKDSEVLVRNKHHGKYGVPDKAAAGRRRYYPFCQEGKQMIHSYWAARSSKLNLGLSERWILLSSIVSKKWLTMCFFYDVFVFFNVLLNKIDGFHFYLFKRDRGVYMSKTF